MMIVVLLAGFTFLGLHRDIDPSSGFSTELNFDAPYAVETGDGTYPAFTGIPTRFVPGEPPRPALTLFIPVPPAVTPELSYTASGYRSTDVASRDVVTPAVEGIGLDAREVPVERRLPPSEHVVLEGIVPMAGTRVAMITVYPVVGPAGGEYASKISLKIEWKPVPGGIPVEEHPLLSLVAPPGCLYWKEPLRWNDEDIFWGSPWARIAIKESGGYYLTGAVLEERGCSVTGSPCGTLRIFTGPGRMFGQDPEENHRLEEVAISVTDVDGDGIFDEEDTIRFFALGLSRWELEESKPVRIFHRYATHNVYWLTWGGENGKRMDTVPGGPDSSPGWGADMLSDIWLREENVWLPVYEVTTGWVWETLKKGESISVPFRVGDTGLCRIVVELISEGSQKHTARLDVNGSQVLVESWYGSGIHVMTAEDVELSGSCVLNVIFQEDAGDGKLSPVSVHVEYPDRLGGLRGKSLFPSREKTGRFNFFVENVSPGCTAYDLSDFDSPLVVEGGVNREGTYLFSMDVNPSTVLMVMDDEDWMLPDTVISAAPGRLKGTVTEGDRLIVVPQALYEGIWGLLEVSSSQGFHPVPATTREIYDEFGQGVADPGAVRSAVRWAMDHWNPGLSALVLVGDGHYDCLGHGTFRPVMIPPYIRLGTGQIDAVDDYYVMVHHGAVLPEIPVSRVPVDNLSQLGTCTAKFLGYTARKNLGDWTGRVLLVADDEWGKAGSLNETEHTVNSEFIAEEVIPRWLEREKFYMIEFPWPSGSLTPEGAHPEKPEARKAFLETFGKGHLFMLYQGHGAVNQIAHEVLMTGEDVGSLENGRRLPVTFWGTCDVGRFDNPGTDAISEAMLLHPSGGAIASVAATRSTYGGSNYTFFRSIIDSLCSYPSLSLGDAVWQTKVALGTSYSNNKYYVLFGYPDLYLPFAFSTGTVTVEGDTLRSGELNRLNGNGFHDAGLALVKVFEAATNTVYTCLGGIRISYVKYGGVAYSGSQTVEGGKFHLDFFLPLQSNTGDTARASACVVADGVIEAGARDPVGLVKGTPSGGDLEGPEAVMWIEGYEGVEKPVVTGEATLVAAITDSSGICFLGGGMGRELSLFVDGAGRDVGRYFTYDRGSWTSGRLNYDMGFLGEGEHILILRSIDGLGNTSMDTLEIKMLDENSLAVTDLVVYPNPGGGVHCFSFRISEDARVSISIHTVAGTGIEELTAFCRQGYNQVIWDGLDRDGDPVASGPYVYRVRATALTSTVFDNITEEYGVLVVLEE